MSGEPNIADLRAESEHATMRLALYRRRMYVGRADGARLAELERRATGAADRLRRAKQRADEARMSSTP
jgi:uncharacterized protein involved in exopolysaccharide biosynthesis